MSTQTAQGTKRSQMVDQWQKRVRIRPLQEKDLPGLEWEGEYAHFRKLYQEAFQRYERGMSVLWVADLPGVGIIGQVFIQLACDRPELADGFSKAYLYSFRVRSQYRRAGLGSRIMDVVEADLSDRGFKIITLNVAKDNVDAQRLYRRRGYRIVAHEPGTWSYPDDKGVWRHVQEPAWRMEKEI
jgi:ribosomal protein S18 acetylase RimI-like enzyme